MHSGDKVVLLFLLNVVFARFPRDKTLPLFTILFHFDLSLHPVRPLTLDYKVEINRTN